MTIRPRAVRALRDVRERQRDAAAATHARATGARDVSSSVLAIEHDRLEAFLDDARETLASASTVFELDRVADLAGGHRLAIADAAGVHAKAIEITEVTAGKLRDSTRQLRSAEKLVELVDEHRSKLESRAEQRCNDDMSARRR